MDEQKNSLSSDNPEKKLSRTTLTFYIVGLFSVAIALILISYVAQARADRQLDTLTDQLTEQQTVAQGATQKVEDLQSQYDVQSSWWKCGHCSRRRLRETDVVGAAEPPHGGASGECRSSCPHQGTALADRKQRDASRV